MQQERHAWRKEKVDKFEVGLVLGLTIVLICILVVGYSPFSLLEGVWWEEINIREEIGKLRTYDDGNYSVLEVDWIEWSRKMRDAEGNFTKMDTWKEFSASLEYRDITFLMLDEEKKVVWYNPLFTNQVIYFEY